MEIVSTVHYSTTIKITVIDRENTIKYEPWMLQFNSQDLGHKAIFFIEKTEESENNFKEWISNA